MIVIIDGIGTNINSIVFALERVGAHAEVTADTDIIQQADKIILPGVGHAQYAMQQLQLRKLDQLIPQLRQPVLGICLGMQLLYQCSTEGDVNTLGILPGAISKFDDTPLPVPHMGWHATTIDHDNPLFTGINGNPYFYYVHSYYAPISDTTIARTEYGVPFSAAIQCGNFFATQFHPERSGSDGERVLANFLALESA